MELGNYFRAYRKASVTAASLKMIGLFILFFTLIDWQNAAQAVRFDVVLGLLLGFIGAFEIVRAFSGKLNMRKVFDWYKIDYRLSIRPGYAVLTTFIGTLIGIVCSQLILTEGLNGVVTDLPTAVGTGVITGFTTLVAFSFLSRLFTQNKIAMTENEVALEKVLTDTQ